MKKIVCVFLVFSFLFALVACNSEPSDPKPSNPAESSVESTAKDNNTSETETEVENDQKHSVLAYLEELLASYSWNPMSKLPATMLPSYKANHVAPTSANVDYSVFVNTNNIPVCSTGEQWHMILENTQQAQTFFNVLTVVEGLTSLSVTVFEAYLDKNPSDTAHHTFKESIYSVTIDCNPTTISYVLDYTAKIPLLGEQTIQIAMEMDILTKSKNVRVQLGDANALTYTIEDNRYTFAIKYLDTDVVGVSISRTAYFAMEENKDGTITGHIYEYLTASSLEVASVADFYITDDYVTVVGNKASGMLAFEGYICELYSTSTGKLLAYEVREKLEALGTEITYNTLFFNLTSINGINSVRYIQEAEDGKSHFYVNNSSSAWESKDVGGLSLKTASRRFDIEFRTQYAYYYDAEQDAYVEIALKIPMLFVQEEYYSDLAKDVKSKNNVTVSVNVSENNLSKLMSDYAALIDVLITNKNAITSSAIIEMIGTKKNFS